MATVESRSDITALKSWDEQTNLGTSFSSPVFSNIVAYNGNDANVHGLKVLQ